MTTTTTTTTFRVKDNTGWKSEIGFKKLKEAIKYAKEKINDELWENATHFYIEVIRIEHLTPNRDKIIQENIIFYIRTEDKWRLSKNYKVVKF